MTRARTSRIADLSRPRPRALAAAASRFRATIRARARGDRASWPSSLLGWRAWLAALRRRALCRSCGVRRPRRCVRRRRSSGRCLADRVDVAVGRAHRALHRGTEDRRSTIGWSAPSTSPPHGTSTPAGSGRVDGSRRRARRVADRSSRRSSRRRSCAGPAFQAAAAVLAACRGRFRVPRRRPAQSFDALSLALFPSRVALEVTPGQRARAGRVAPDDRGAAGRQPRAGRRAAPARRGRRRRRLARRGDARRDASGRFTLVAQRPGHVVPLPRRRGRRHVADVRRHRRPCAARDAHRRRVHLSEGARPRAARRRGRRRHLRAGRHRRPRPRAHGSSAAASGRLVLGRRQGRSRSPPGTNGVLTGSLQVVEDNSYRVALADAEGLTSRGDTEYFIRTLEDRPPEVRVVKPARDRRVTRLEEVDIEAEAEDDFGIASLDLVYAVRGGTEKVVPLRIPQRATSVDRPAHAVPRGSRRRSRATSSPTTCARATSRAASGRAKRAATSSSSR